MKNFFLCALLASSIQNILATDLNQKLHSLSLSLGLLRKAIQKNNDTIGQLMKKDTKESVQEAAKLRTENIQNTKDAATLLDEISTIHQEWDKLDARNKNK